ncbi:DNA-binding protein [Acinetobacter proteolyticus]|uniref:DNA-binding protein n=2 Tax=Acinetobacter proteolyticus TaxID=1776741 RepID=A0A2N0WFA1_9GAMM|nr:DNA-binding protein [Acinetobacter proteolyticus]
MNEDDNKVVTMKVRVTPEFREQLVTTAKGNNRSMNAEIVDRLEKSFEQPITSEHEVNDLRELLKQSIENNKKYFQIITELLKKSKEN